MPDSVMLFFKITEIEELSSQKSDVVFVKVDVDENEEAAAVRLFFTKCVPKYILPFSAIQYLCNAHLHFH